MSDPQAAEVVLTARDDMSRVFAAAESSMASMAGQMDGLSAQAGASGKNLMALALQAQMSGTAFVSVEQGLTHLSGALKEGDQDSQRTAAALKKLGLEASALRGKDTAQSLLTVAQALNKVEDGAEKTALAQDLLGKNAAKLLPYLKDLTENGRLSARITEGLGTTAGATGGHLGRLSGHVSHLAKTLAQDAIPGMRQFDDAMNRARRDGAGPLEAGLVGVGTGMAGLLARTFALAAVPLGLVGIASFVSSTAESVAKLDDMAEKTGASVENLSALSEQAKISGVELNSVETGLIRLAVALKSGDEESKNAGKALKALGLEAAELRSMDTAEAMLAVAKALSGYQDGAAKTALAQDLLGKSGAQLLPYLKDLAETGKLNGKITTEQAAEAERYEKQLNTLAVEWGNLTRSLALDAIPQLNQITATMIRARKEGAGPLETALIGLGAATLKLAGVDLSRGHETLEEAERKVNALFRERAELLGQIKAAREAGGDAEPEAGGDAEPEVPVELSSEGDPGATREAEIAALEERIKAINPELNRLIARTGRLTEEEAANLPAKLNYTATAKPAKAATAKPAKAATAKPGAFSGPYIDTRAEEAELAALRDAEAARRLDDIAAMRKAQPSDLMALQEAAQTEGSDNADRPGFAADFFAKRREEETAFTEWQVGMRAERETRQLEADRAAFDTQFQARTAEFLKQHEQNLNWYEQGLIDEEEYQRRKLDMATAYAAANGDVEAQAAQKRAAFAKQSLDGQISQTAGALAKGLQYAAQTNRKAFEAQKVFAIAQGAIDGYKGALKTWNDYPYPWNIPMTIAHIAGTAGYLNQLKSASFGGGGGTLSVPAGGGATLTAPASNSLPPLPVSAAESRSTEARRATTLNVYITGDTVPKQSIAELIERINEEQRKGNLIDLVVK